MSDHDWAAWSLPLGLALDALLGDPRGWPHPVRGVGWLIARIERALRRGLGARPRPIAGRLAGVGLAILVVGVTTAAA